MYSKYNLLINKTISFTLLTITDLILSIIFKNISVFIFSFFVSSIIFMMNEILFKNEFNLYKLLPLIWFIINLFTIFLYIAYIQKFGVPYDMIGLDDYNFDKTWSDECLQMGLDSIPKMLSSSSYYLHNSKLYVLLIVHIKKITSFFGGYHTMDIRFINMLSLFMIAFLLGKYMIKHSLFDSKTLHKFIVICILHPNLLFVTCHVYRDTIVCFLVILVFYLSSDLFDATRLKKIFYLFIIIICTISLYWLRAVSIIYVFLILFINLIGRNNHDYFDFKNKNNLFKIILFIFFCILLLFLFGSKLTHYMIAYSETLGTGVQSKIFNIPIFPLGWIIRCIYYLFTPMYFISFNELDNLYNFILFFVNLGTYFFIFFYPFLFIGLRKFNNISITFLGLYFSIILTTGGFRHVIVYYPFLFAISLREISFSSNKLRYQIFTFSLTIVFIFFCIYFLFKL